MREAIQMVANIGFTTVPDKTQGPVTSIIFLGILLDTERGVIAIPAAKLRVVREELTLFLRRSPLWMRKNEIEHLAGVLRYIAGPMREGKEDIDELHRLCGVAGHPRMRLFISQAGKDQLQRWACRIDSHLATGEAAWERLFRSKPAQIVRSISDASGAFGAAIVAGATAIQLKWVHPGLRDIGAQELLPLLVLYRELGHQLAGSVVVFSTDNASVAYAINKGTSSSESMRKLVSLIRQEEVRLNSIALGDHVPREVNEFSDGMSKGLSYVEALERGLQLIVG